MQRATYCGNEQREQQRAVAIVPVHQGATRHKLCKLPQCAQCGVCPQRRHNNVRHCIYIQRRRPVSVRPDRSVLIHECFGYLGA